MRPFSPRKNQLSLQNKVFLTFVALLLFILGCFIVYVNLVVIKPLKEKTVEAKLAAATKVSQQLDDYVDSQNQLSQRILSSKDIFAILERGYQTDVNIERLNQSRRLKDLMFQAIGPRMNIKDMVIYDKAGRQIVSYLGERGDAASLEGYLKKSLMNGSWSGSGFVLERQGDTVSFIRPINNQNGKVFGYLSILLDETFLQRMTHGIGAGEVYILDQVGRSVAGSMSEAEHAELTARDRDSGVYADNYRNYVAYSRSESTGWTTYLVTPKGDVLGPVNSVKYLSILLITSLLLLSFVYIYFSSRNLLLPIRKLRSQIWRISYSNMNIKMDTRSQNNELILLNEAFQDLMERLQESIEREKIALHEEVKARNSALQAQIAPHFIHNVLYLISIAAQEGKTEVVSDMCKHLSDSLRYIVSSPYAHVTLADELEHTRHYLSLVQQKYEEDLVWEIHADESVRNVQLPRLVLQPFVENCIEHAFSRSDPPWRIDITVKQFNGLWAVEIKDNGDGFPPGKIAEIMDNLRAADADREGEARGTSIGNMGIVNSVGRLKLMYQNRLFFNVFNHADGEKGATVQIIGSLTKDFY
ncbi:histidine kinase [Paenibacillus sp. DXFW5]|uniref:Histidine kinase n=1 Tax=Paenibacillus rhizolycopersici TaxID=2780073 RepID=A0ABS2H9R4_9BACL|nr:MULTISPECIES: sensor histidine kinase [Paenibacillus]MBM6996248.1 histidine kinase [Paenibacillus rhizolycopersici]MUG85104.1 HAMP domain-containing protein [Paenibacillus timonensis]